MIDGLNVADQMITVAIGPLDDVVVVALTLRYAARHIPGEVAVEA